jgi:hypothetical protein
MAKRDDNTTAEGTRGASGSTVDSMEQRMLAFAEQLGRVVGTVQAKAEGWLDRDALNAQISSVRDSASDLLDQLRSGMQKAAAASRPASGSKTKVSGSMGNQAANTKGGAKGKGAAKTKGSAKGKVASKVRASATSGSDMTGAGKSRSGGAVDAPGKKHRKPMPSEAGATGAPRGEGARIAKLKAVNQNRVQRRG